MRCFDQADNREIYLSYVNLVLYVTTSACYLASICLSLNSRLFSLRFQRTGGLGSRGDTHVELRRYAQRVVPIAQEAVQRQ